MEKTKIVELVTNIIYNTFKNISVEKTKLKIHTNRIQFACPFCGDSEKKTSSKRGHLYLDRNLYKCYNAGCSDQTLSILAFFNKFNVLSNFTLDEIEKLEFSNTQKQTHKNVNNSSLLKIAIPRKLLKDKLYLKEYHESKNDVLKDFIKTRKLEPYVNRILLNDKLTQLYICNTTIDGKRILSVQIRNFNAKYAKYRTLNWLTLIEKCGLQEHLTFEQKTIDIINNESTKFGVLELNQNDIVFITEGGLDSFFLDNSIGASGIKNMSSFEYLPKPYFIYDNDTIGKEFCERSIRKGYNVFLWDRFLEDNNLSKKHKDINDVFIIKNFTKKELLCYFSNNPLDLMMI